MTLTRRPDWRSRLALYVSACRKRAFTYGAFDCALFANGAVLAETGVDLRAGLAGAYTTELGAARFLRRNGLAHPADAAARFLPEIAVADARHGDIAVLETQDGVALAVVGGPHILAARAGIGLIALPLTAAYAAFKV